MGPRLISEAKARVAPPSASVLNSALEPCAPVVPPPPVEPSSRFEPETRFVTDEEIMGPIAREHEAASSPPYVHCHFYLGETQLHLGVRGGEAARAQIAGFGVALSLHMNVAEGSSFVVEVSREGASVLRNSHSIVLAAPPIAPGCGGPGFTGWLRPDAALSLFCEALAADSR